MSARFIAESETALVREVVLFIEETVDDWNRVLPEAHAFLRDCNRFLDIIDPLTQRKRKSNYSTTRTLVEDGNNNNNANSIPLLSCYPQQEAPISDIDVLEARNSAERIQSEIVQSICQAKLYVQEFIDENARNRPYLKNLKWLLTRAFVVKDYRIYFQEESSRIRMLLGDMMLNQEILKNTSTPSIRQFDSDMSQDSYTFWTKHLGDKITVSWIEFRDAYNLLYGSLEPFDSEYIQSVLCTKGDEPRLTVYGFITFMRKHGFPFEKNVALRKASEQPAIGEDKRMEIAKMVMTLVNEFASPDMKTHLVAIYTWYVGIPTDDAKALQERADEWARLVKASRNCDNIVDESHKRADQVDSARRAISLFYQEYMVMWRIGQVSREMFKDVDFPGKGRIRDFIRYVLPLDRSNFLIVMGGDESKWDDKRPKVYDFLRKMLD